MRARVSIPLIVVLALAASGAAYLATRAPQPLASNLPTRTMTVGAIDVTVQPVRLDANGAVFRVSLDTHSTDLSMALSGTLQVDGVMWSGGAWAGAGPGGHHREGEIRFEAEGSARGTARLEVNGFDARVVGEWQLGGNDGT